MAHSKITMEQILKPTAKLAAVTISQSPKALALIEKTKRQIEHVLKLKEIDLSLLENTFVTI